MGYSPFSSDSIVFNENSIASLIAELMLTLDVNGPLRFVHNAAVTAMRRTKNSLFSVDIAITMRNTTTCGGGGGVSTRGVSSWRGAWSQGVSCRGGCLVRWGCARGVPGGDTPRDGYCCGRYASYWNAFLFYI